MGSSLFLTMYKNIVPKKIKNRITMLRNAGGLDTIRKKILRLYDSPEKDLDGEIKAVLTFLKKNPLKLFPYRFPDRYKASTVKVYTDVSNQMMYVLHENKRLYFKRSWSKKDIRENYNNLRIEQDENSPHRYLNEGFKLAPFSIVADVGAAEGIFALSVIEEAESIFIFESDTEWIEALRETFKPWSSKVTIINKYVSDIDNEHNITLDDFAKNNNIRFDFIKIDVDGVEHLLLKGAIKTLSNSVRLKIVICTYHKAEDEKLFSRILNDFSFSVAHSDGYMIFYYDSTLSAPFLRRGVLRANK